MKRSAQTGSPPRMAASSSEAKVATSKLISQGHDSFELIFMMLMGIRTAVGKFCAAALSQLGQADFNQKWEGNFLARGSAETPAHAHRDFDFKDYAPRVFRELREHFGISAQDYMLSLTSEYVLVEMFTNSKSGSFFFYSSDYRFVLKTCTKREAAFLLAALPQYHRHLMDNRFTLLCRFFGLHRVSSRSGKRVYFVVMGNVFPVDRSIQERYDLKGSTRDRFTSDAERKELNVVLKATLHPLFRLRAPHFSHCSHAVFCSNFTIRTWTLSTRVASFSSVPTRSAASSRRSPRTASSSSD